VAIVLHSSFLSQQIFTLQIDGSGCRRRHAVRILIVEDSALVQRMYGLAFSRRSHEMVLAANGQEALDTIKSEAVPFDLILLDLRMPDMNGVDFLTALKQRGGPPIPVVLVTAESDESPLVHQARELGAAAVVHKPWKPTDLREVVHRVLPGAPL
jgi:CheY-like chemotaxis protein